MDDETKGDDAAAATTPPPLDYLAAIAAADESAPLVDALSALAAAVASGAMTGDKKTIVKACAARRKVLGAVWGAPVKVAFNAVLAAIKARDASSGCMGGSCSVPAAGGEPGLLRTASFGETGRHFEEYFARNLELIAAPVSDEQRVADQEAIGKMMQASLAMNEEQIAVATEGMKARQREKRKLITAELRPQLEKLFVDFDRDGNGVLDVDESTQLIRGYIEHAPEFLDSLISVELEQSIKSNLEMTMGGIIGLLPPQFYLALEGAVGGAMPKLKEASSKSIKEAFEALKEKEETFNKVKEEGLGLDSGGAQRKGRDVL